MYFYIITAESLQSENPGLSDTSSFGPSSRCPVCPCPRQHRCPVSPSSRGRIHGGSYTREKEGETQLHKQDYMLTHMCLSISSVFSEADTQNTRWNGLSTVKGKPAVTDTVLQMLEMVIACIFTFQQWEHLAGALCIKK